MSAAASLATMGRIYQANSIATMGRIFIISNVIHEIIQLKASFQHVINFACILVAIELKSSLQRVINKSIDEFGQINLRGTLQRVMNIKTNII